MNHPKLDRKLTQVTRPAKGWIGFDLDGTLAEYDGWKGVDHIGAPIPSMVLLVHKYLAAGQEVRILTARAGRQKDPQDIVHAIQAIRAWCMKHIGQELPVTAEKDFSMVWLYDDRCTQVLKNTGILVQPPENNGIYEDPDQADPEPEKPEEHTV